MDAHPGKQSSEFFALVLLAAVIVANGTEYVNIDNTTLNTFIASIVAYIGQRGWVKTTTAKANAEMAATAVDRLAAKNTAQ